MSNLPSNLLPDAQSPARPSLKRSLTSFMQGFSRKPANHKAPRKAASWGNHRELSGRPEAIQFQVPTRPSRHTPVAHAPVEIVESGGLALADAQDAFTNTKYAVWTRILWSYPSEYEPGVQMVFSRIESKGTRERLALLGVKQYLETGRGAIFCNAHLNANDSSQLLVDWVTFRDTQKTRDKLLQQDILGS